MRTGQIICNYCKAVLVHPAMIDVKMNYRLNVGADRSMFGLAHDETIDANYGVMGYVEVEIEGDFCDYECLWEYALKVATSQDPYVKNVRQDIFFRGEPLTLGRPKSEW